MTLEKKMTVPVGRLSNNEKSTSKRRSLRWPAIAAILMGLIILVASIVGVSQVGAQTPAITSPDGQPLPGSIASLEKVELGGVDQWLIIRGQSVDKPVLLFLSGGPGGSEAGRVLRFNQELEQHFVVVIWEQRGCGKSYAALNPRSALTVEQYAADVIELADMLRARFDENKIYLLGHSWGTIIGVRAVQERPDLFHAYIGTAQMVNVRETDQTIYRMLLENALETGDTGFVEQLKAQGPPPYFGNNPVGRYARMFTREYQVFEMASISSEEFRREGDLLLLALRQPEYGWLDRVNFMRVLMDTFNVVYPQLQDVDLRDDALTFGLPVYFILGRHDVNGTYWLAEDYFNRLQAPHKRLYIFEDSGHGMIWQETDKFHDIMINTVLPETYQP
jgi:pimeloyl-ACP methyl ester carboxylesterase